MKNINLFHKTIKSSAILMMVIAAFSVGLMSCIKEDKIEFVEPGFSAAGFWQVKGDPTFISNDTLSLFHLFVEPNAFYRLTFSNKFDFSKLELKPRPDTIVGFYKIEGNVLKIPNPAPSISNSIQGLTLESQTAGQMNFSRYYVVRRSLLTGEILEDRTDKITYESVSDAAKVAYFKNFISKYHK